MQKNTIKQAVQEQFGHAASHYSSSAVHVAGADLDAMLQALPLDPAWRVLDVGCGAGHTALAFAPHVAEVVAADLTPAMLAQLDALAATRGISNIRTQHADVEAMPFADASFDLVVSRYSAHHWPQPEQALHEIRRVLRPGAAFILGDIVAPADWTQDTFLQTLELLRDPSHVRDHSVRDWLNKLAEAGFTDVEQTGQFPISLHFGDWLARMHTPPVMADAIRALFAGAPAEIKAAFSLPDLLAGDDFSFVIPAAVFCARLA